MATETLPTPRNGVVDAAQIVASLAPSLLGAGRKTERSGTTENLSANDAVLASVMGDINDPNVMRGVVDNIMTRAAQAFAPAYASEKSAGLYNSNVTSMLRDEYAARATGEASAAVLQHRSQAQQTAAAAAKTQAEGTKETVNYTSQKPAIPGAATAMTSAALLGASLMKFAPAALSMLGLGGGSGGGGSANEGAGTQEERDAANTSEDMIARRRRGKPQVPQEDANVPENPVDQVTGGNDPLEQIGAEAGQAFPEASVPTVEEILNPGGAAATAGATARGVAEAGGGFGGDATTFGANIGEGGGDGFGLIDTGVQAAGVIANAVTQDFANRAVNSVANPILNGVDIGGGGDFPDEGGDAVDTGVPIIDGAGNGVNDTVNDLTSGNVQDIIPDVVTNVGGVISDAVGDIGDAVGGILDSIICTELYRQGKLNKHHYFAAAIEFYGYWAYGKRGYYLWSRACVRYLRAHPDSWFSTLLALVFRVRNKQVAYHRGVKGTRWTLSGLVLHRGMYAVCWVLAILFGWAVKMETANGR
jgi:hypothetical protein